VVSTITRVARARHRARVRFQPKGVRGTSVRSAADTRPCRRRRRGLWPLGAHAKNAIALARLKTEFKGKVEILQYPTALLRDLKKLAAEVVKEESEKSPMARKVYASFTKFQALLSPWDRVAEGAYHQLVAG